MSRIVWKTEGFKGFFRGTTLSIVKNTMSYSLFFAGIENMGERSKYQIYS
jgi:hypothetical protein